MKVNVLLFGRLISVAGRRVIPVFLEGETRTVIELKKSIFGAYPSIEEERFRVVVNQDISRDDDVITESDEVALLPPISGGNYSYLTESPITHELVESVSRRYGPGTGSVLIFLGIVRNDHAAQKPGTEEAVKQVRSIIYSAYEGMAEKKINEIILSAKRDFGLRDVVLKHRVGEVAAGEIAFFVSVSSEHRREGLAGIEFIIDEVKSRVPVWKLECYDDGSARWKDGVLIK